MNHSIKVVLIPLIFLDCSPDDSDEDMNTPLPAEVNEEKLKKAESCRTLPDCEMPISPDSLKVISVENVFL
jgi:hypothetical protein